MRTDNQEFTREDFMVFFRDNQKLHSLTSDDRIEIFKTILTGSSDITKDLLDGLLKDYSIPTLKIVEIENEQ
ncbi:hypothetical protein EHR04_09350 [Leptospira levettii]|uniref:hypothetical protein n=1 Tax=Leptospira levettii TaxID=2023178 RepID=UPI001082AFC9|nr:hypothetical protein [Leptospira levettii]MCW7507030.1 hypothetical protein [Leptospira levettii]MCW7518120.1 hypothetical protein [Leptospira levettii]TGK99480.1 hypothetical protein EHQ34_14820 [Leptospira levettii]TGM24849.1 hypothetical protein EHQ74_14995 [Leptospira levettii]TGM29866.1 hypothetical protein EHQ71_14050 [Leptospira levettii]